MAKTAVSTSAES